MFKENMSFIDIEQMTFFGFQKYRNTNIGNIISLPFTSIQLKEIHRNQNRTNFVLNSMIFLLLAVAS